MNIASNILISLCPAILASVHTSQPDSPSGSRKCAAANRAQICGWTFDVLLVLLCQGFEYPPVLFFETRGIRRDRYVSGPPISSLLRAASRFPSRFEDARTRGVIGSTRRALALSNLSNPMAAAQLPEGKRSSTQTSSALRTIP